MRLEGDVRIHFQGNFEGTCFPYSIANAVLSLSKARLKQNAWDKGLNRMPFREDFVTSKGTQSYDDNWEMLCLAAKRFLNGWESEAGKYLVRVVDGINRKAALCSYISDNSVLLVNHSGYHWVCLVDANRATDRLYCACSFQLAEKAEKYKEERSPDTKRWFNLEYDMRDLGWVYQSTGILIRLIQ